MHKRNILSALALLAFSLAVGLKAATFPYGDLRRIGPGFFPLVLASLWACCLWLFWRGPACRA